MTAAPNSQQLTDNEASSPLAARLDLLVRRAINVEQFEADMVRYCTANPDEVWNLLALLDQYHRLEKLPTDLFRSLKASADRYGLVRREPYIPYLSPKPAPEARPPEALAPPPVVPSLAPPTTPAPDATGAPFRHLLGAAPASDNRDAISVPQDQWNTGRFVRPEPLPPKRSWLRPLLLMIILAGAIAAAALLGRLGNPAAVVSNWKQMRDAVSGTPNPPASTPTASQLVAVVQPAAAPEPAAAAPPAPAALTPDPEPTALVTAPPSPEPQAAAAAPTPARIELSADRYAVTPGDSAARILVRRSGNLQGEVSFVWWAEGDSAKTDVDFIAWGHRTEKIAAGHNSITLLVPIINDATRTAPRSFHVAIGEAGNGASLGATTRATVQLPGKG